MRVVKSALVGVIAIFAVIWLMSLLFPSFVKVSRAVNINTTKEAVLDYVPNVNQWARWNEMTSSKNLTHKKITGNVFSSDQLQLQVESIHGDSVDILWTQKNGRKIHGGFNLYGSSDTTLTTVQWYFDFNLRWYPWEKIGSIIFDKQLGPVMEKSLENLRNLIEKKQ